MDCHVQTNQSAWWPPHHPTVGPAAITTHTPIGLSTLWGGHRFQISWLSCLKPFHAPHDLDPLPGYTLEWPLHLLVVTSWNVLPLSFLRFGLTRNFWEAPFLITPHSALLVSFCAHHTLQWPFCFFTCWFLLFHLEGKCHRARTHSPFCLIYEWMNDRL